jgi:hypothetical protein
MMLIWNDDARNSHVLCNYPEQIFRLTSLIIPSIIPKSMRFPDWKSENDRSDHCELIQIINMVTFKIFTANGLLLIALLVQYAIPISEGFPTRIV